jgi:hypothetical protein
MPTGKNWFQFIYVNLGFVLFIVLIYYYISIKEIKDNWPQYRCNPMYMPLADNIGENFQYCIQSSQSSFMGYLLQPITFATSNISNIMGGAIQDINGIRTMFDKVRTFLTSIIQSVFGVFLNLVIEFQRITIGIKDLIAKQIGIMATFIYVLDGSIMTMKSMWNGPPGQLVKAIGKCFHPNTPIVLQSGEIIPMKKVKQGAILKDGSRVIATMKIDNTGPEPESFYKIKTTQLDKLIDIYVTGSHMIYEETLDEFVKVCNYKGATNSKKKSKWFSCLITDTHKIHIGEKVFWDWEDYSLKLGC